MTEQATWLPNLVGGVSIWKLAPDLNEAQFMDGRLLVPETEGSESLPVTVRWDLTGLEPLAEARAKDPEGVAAAVRDFQACLERTAKVFATPNSGYDKYKPAFTVPSLEADGGGSYWYSPSQKKLFVANWGASPRSMGGRAEYVFGWEDWGKVFAGAAVGAAATAAVATPTPAVPEAPTTAANEEPKKPEEKEKKPAKVRPWWFWPLFALVAIAAVLLVLLLLRGCEDGGAADAADAAPDAEAGALADAGEDAETAALEDGGDEATSAEDAGLDARALADAGSDAGATGDDAGADGGLAMTGGDDDDPDDGTPGSSGGAGSSGGTVVVRIGPAADIASPKSGPHRRHYQEEATAWRVAAGMDRVARTEQRGRRFDVWLGAGRTFDGVRVEWQDASGKWHVH